MSGSLDRLRAARVLLLAASRKVKQAELLLTPGDIWPELRRNPGPVMAPPPPRRAMAQPPRGVTLRLVGGRS